MQKSSPPFIPIKLWRLDNIEEALKQARNRPIFILPHKWIAIMPGKATRVWHARGGVLAAQDVIVPNAVGVDIGCGMLAAHAGLQEIPADLPADHVGDPAASAGRV